MLATAAPEATEVELVIGGMTCAACAARVQAKLNKVDGVTASVNLTTERAHVTAPAHLSARDLVAVVEAAVHGTLTLSPFGDDVVLQDPVPFETRQSVPLTLTFRYAGTVTIQATVTAPGTP